MATWATVELTSSEFAAAADITNGYVQVSYMANGYLRGAVWAAVDTVDTTWS
jgi:hypothetical protein